MNKKPNIVYFVADQMRADSLAHLGNPASITPNLDAVVREGVSFKNTYCQNPICVPSRISFLSGLYPHTTGHRTIHYLQNEGEPNILRTMKNNGYEVVWIGRNDVVPGDRTKEDYCDCYYQAFGDGDAKSVKGGEFAGMKAWLLKAQEEEKTKAAEGAGSVEPSKAAQGTSSSESLKAAQSTDSAEPPKAAESTEPAKDPSAPGYYSFHIGKIDLTQDRTSHMFARYDWSCIGQALDYIEEKSAQKDGEPFFLYITLTYPHPEYMCEEPWFSSIDRKKLPPRRPSAASLEGKPSMLREIAKKQNLADWGEENFDEMRATYLAMVSRFDHQYGMVSDKLKECGFYDDTSIFVFSDHGDYTGDYDIAEKVQNCFDNPVSNVPLLVKPAKQFAVTPRISDALVELVDLTATVEEMTGVKTEFVNFGKSLVPVLEREIPHKDAVFCEGGRVHGETWAMERGHGEESPYWPRLSTQESEGPEHTKAVMCRMGSWKYVYRLYEEDELYDLEEDPTELHNRIGEPEQKDRVNAMKLRILDWMIETGDIVPDRKDIR